MVTGCYWHTVHWNEQKRGIVCVDDENRLFRNILRANRLIAAGQVADGRFEAVIGKCLFYDIPLNKK